MKKKGIKVKLFSVSHSDGKIIPNRLCDGYILGKNLFINTLQNGFESKEGEFFNEYSFDYQYNIPFDCSVQISNKKSQKLNIKIIYPKVETSQNFNQLSYAYLNSYHRFINSFHFNRLWIQQPMNIMWITNILIIILLGLTNLFF